MNPLILFSGGLDSTYMLQQYLQKGSVDVMYINAGQDEEKMKLELRQRQVILEKFSEFYPYKVQAQYERLKSTQLQGDNTKWSQVAPWLFGALAIADSARHSKLMIGYVSDDGAYFGSHLRYIEDAWYNLQKVSCVNDPIPIEFPLLGMTKVDILRDLDKRVLNDIWICETPTNEKHCGKCKPCVTMTRVLSDYKIRHKETVFATARRALIPHKFPVDRYPGPMDKDHNHYVFNMAGPDYYKIPRH
ncbi:7-cyano-7-deazaguanine synthase [Pseudomonas phage PA1C]|nr:7-cyano-7-deazaguanine synthase [Pseudomonas phage PA1C]BEG72489.1 hypothetical protein RVBP21_1170 [Pseudomonas phage BRkr]